MGPALENKTLFDETSSSLGAAGGIALHAQEAWMRE